MCLFHGAKKNSKSIKQMQGKERNKTQGRLKALGNFLGSFPLHLLLDHPLLAVRTQLDFSGDAAPQGQYATAVGTVFGPGA